MQNEGREGKRRGMEVKGREREGRKIEKERYDELREGRGGERGRKKSQ